MTRKISRRVKLRTIALALAIATLMTVFPLNILAVTSEEDVATGENVGAVTVLHNGVQENTITLDENGRETLTVFVSGITIISRSWQILTPDGTQWVSIFGKTQESLDVTYSLVASMLNDKNTAYIRCAIEDGSALYVSEPVAIIMSYNTGDGIVTVNNSTTTDQYLLFGGQTVSADTSDIESTLGTHNIVINYIFDNGGLAFEPYGATVAKGSDFIKSVTSPTVVGYKPFMRVGDSYVDASVVELNYTNITQDIVINVIYEPAMVEFQIHHHLQNLHDDDYSLHADYITKGMGLTGSVVTGNLAMTEAELPGFKALAYETMTVAADGSTVIEIRYDRNYYLVSFDMVGGYGTEPVYTRYGASVGANAPTRHGYLFDSWELVSYGGNTPSAEQASMYDINSTVITVPNANLTYRAKWITQVVSYTMVFWKENINDNGYTYWGYLDGLSAMSGSYVSGADRIGEVAGITDEAYFTYNDILTDKNVMVEGDGSTIVNVYYTRNRYAITFKAKGKCTIPEGHVHGDSCNITLCKSEHTHDESCLPLLDCTIPEHEAHNSDCVMCGKEEHYHSSSCCGLVEHTHDKSCWNSVSTASSRPSGAPAAPEDGYIHATGNGWFGRTYYIYIKGTWYRYSGRNVSSGDIVDTKCGYDAEHTHGAADCGCDIEVHTHIDSCFKDITHIHDAHICYKYSCGQEAHIHTDDCYLLNCGIPEGHTHTSTCTNANSTNTVKIVYRKYQQNLEDIWPIVDDNGVRYNQGERWKPSDSDTYSQVLVYIAIMPAEKDGFTLTLDESSNDTYTMNYYLEVLPGESYTHTYEGKHFILYTTVKANYNYITEAEDFFSIHGYDSFASDPTFSGGQIDINGGGVVNFYYSRMVDHVLEFRSNGVVLNDKTVHGIHYGASLKDYNFVPPYPDSLEPNAYVFGGWYTSPGHFDGTEVNWNTITMDAGDVMLYAKWSPTTHTVKVYLTDSLEQQLGETQTVPHGNFALSPSGSVTNGNYIFQGWFYKDTTDGETVEKAFVFTGIPVLEDMVIYAKWSSHVSVSYKINYVLYNTKEVIAPPTVGSAIAGHNKTFYAKAGDELNVGFREGYYPLTNSHSVTMSAESDHEYTFEYVYVESVPYLVRYLDADGNTVFTAKKVMDNTLSVVTETFVRIDKMMPDAYQKRLVLSASGEDADGDGILDNNVITFRYSSDEVHAYYRVVHYIQNISRDGYREYRSEDTVGVIGQSYTVSSISITGFSFNGQKTSVNGTSTPTDAQQISATLTSDGLLIELYYDRVEVKYAVKYLESGTDKVLHTQKEGTGIFGEQVVEYAPGLTHLGYTLVSEEVKQLHLSTNESINVIEFYYQETIYSLKYQIIGYDGCGSLSMSSENILAVSGEAGGSTPTINSGYHFAGWYLDAACTKPVDASWVDGETYHITPKNDGVWLSNATYYAKIDPDFTTLTITTRGTSSADAGQVFMFRIKGNADKAAAIDITVSVAGDNMITISDLPIGSYTVTELTEWSFRYTPDSVSKSIELSVDATKNALTFDHTRDMTSWLDGNGNAANQFN